MQNALLSYSVDRVDSANSAFGERWEGMMDDKKSAYGVIIIMSLMSKDSHRLQISQERSNFSNNFYLGNFRL